jgi:hypothetical protein
MMRQEPSASWSKRFAAVYTLARLVDCVVSICYPCFQPLNGVVRARAG